MDSNEQNADVYTTNTSNIITEATDEQNGDETPGSRFKKPLLVGKIGRLPKKLKNSQASEVITQEICGDVPKEVGDSNNETVSEVESIPQKADSLSLQYKEPTWSGLPKSTSQSYHFEVLKEGSIIETVNLMNKSFWVFGRLANCDISMQHPTISRYHAVLQYRSEPDEKNEAGFYIYDLGSTHGTFLNKNKLRPRVYVRIQVGHILKLGCSTRNYLLNGPEDDTEEESELSVTELKQKRKEEIERREQERIEEIEKVKREEEERKRREEERGIDWGLGEDADEEADISENPYAQSNNEDLYLDDPKKTLRGFFEREGLNLEYDCSEQGMGQFLCKVELPIDDDKGRPVHAEALHKGKKKEAVVQCALEACRILDRYGLLRQAVHESRKRKAKDWAENDYYDSDDDTFLDRTGEIEKKREKRMNSKNPKKAETYESLMEKQTEIAKSIKTLEKQLMEAQDKARNSSAAPSDEDSLDAFMKDLKDSKPDKTTLSKLRNELGKLKQEHAKVIKLVNIAKPASLPPLVPQYDTEVSCQSGKSKVLPIFGKRKKVPVVVPKKSSEPDYMDVDDDDEEEETIETVENDNIEKSNGESEPQKIEENPKNADESQRICTYGLQKPGEKINNQSVRSDESVEGKCCEILDRLSKKVEHVSKQIFSLKDSKLKKQKSHDLFHSLSKGAEKILEDLDGIQAEKSEEFKEEKPSENRVEKSDEDKAVKTTGVGPSIEIDTSTEEALRKKKNQRRIQQRQEKAEIEKKKGYIEDSKKEDYSMWVPPKDQTGDGRTKLNEKFGY